MDSVDVFFKQIFCLQILWAYFLLNDKQYLFGSWIGGIAVGLEGRMDIALPHERYMDNMKAYKNWLTNWTGASVHFVEVQSY